MLDWQETRSIDIRWPSRPVLQDQIEIDLGDANPVIFKTERTRNVWPQLAQEADARLAEHERGAASRMEGAGIRGNVVRGGEREPVQRQLDRSFHIEIVQLARFGEPAEWFAGAGHDDAEQVSFVGQEIAATRQIDT